MRAAERAFATWMLALALGLSGCASSRAPRGWLDEPRDVPESPYGGWVAIDWEDRRLPPLEGELLAVGRESLYVMTPRGFEAAPRSGVKHAQVEVYRPQTGRAVGQTGAGMAASLSHGWGFIISGPLWLVAGSLTAGGVSREPRREVAGWMWDSVSIYARFPGGLPPGLDRDALAPKPGTAALLAVKLKGEETLLVRRVQVSSLGTVTLDLPDGTRRHTSAVHIEKITDVRGHDLTREILAGH